MSRSRTRALEPEKIAGESNKSLLQVEAVSVAYLSELGWTKHGRHGNAKTGTSYAKTASPTPFLNRYLAICNGIFPLLVMIVHGLAMVTVVPEFTAGYRDPSVYELRVDRHEFIDRLVSSLPSVMTPSSSVTQIDSKFRSATYGSQWNGRDAD
ncbi:hypothetical protein GGX14DRAFT_405147 [Mycena pura]|uniref:Uncharacterized protein n=1 Tax=Mycena pura TaxID=153505 RepID=A0AAD6Y6P5_9AGAR|nr:hypothetical protein GGX14DRAFT_405147 [Mycena pura]